MPIRKFNYTGRKKILNEDIEIQVISNTERPYAEIKKLNLERYQLPVNANLYLEPRFRTIAKRFHLGTCRNPNIKEKLFLDEFQNVNVLKFLFKVVDLHSKIIAENDNIKPKFDLKVRTKTLVHVRLDDIGDEIWQLNFNNDSPEIIINKSIDDWKELVTSNQFICLVLPQVFREILKYVFLENEWDTSDDEEDWGIQWIKFIEQQLEYQVQIPSEKSDRKEWIEEVVNLFCEKKRILHLFEKR